MKPALSVVTGLAVAGALIALAVVIRWRVQSPAESLPSTGRAAVTDNVCTDAIAKMVPEFNASSERR